MNHQRLFTDNLELIERLVRISGRRHHLSPVEQQDFAGYVNLELLKDDCATLRKFQNRSSWWTYLATVVEKLALDFLIQRWGRWRPSAMAEKLGPVAVILDRLVHRDGHPLEEAMEILRTNHAVGLTYSELRAIWDQLPLSDIAIAERLELTRQQVINSRKSARQRLARRLRQE